MGKLLILLSVSLCLGISTATKITLENILTGDYRASGFSGTWISDTELQYTEEGHVKGYEVETGGIRTIIDGTPFDQTNYPGRTLTPSSDNNFILVTHTRKSVWRSSFLAKYHIYDKTAETFHPLLPPGFSDTDPQPELQLVRWSPAGNALVFVYENNIYYRRSAVAGVAAERVTTDGTALISNGHTDWVYEEEMFGTGSALWFSPSGNRLAYVKFDDTAVEDFEFPMYGEPGVKETAYPTWKHIRYPKSGTTNPTATMYFVDLSQASFPQEPLRYDSNVTPDNLHYISTAGWTIAEELVIIHLTRRQDKSTWFSCVATAGATDPHCAEVWSEAVLNGWIDSNGFRVSANGDALLTLSSALTIGAEKSFRHIVKIGQGAKHVQPVYKKTDGATAFIHVDNILGWVEGVNGKIYFSGNREENPSESQIFTVSDSSAEENVEASCITCSLRNGADEACQANSASFSTGFKYFLHSCSGPSIPEVAFRKTDTPTPATKVWVDNKALREKLVDVEVPTVREYSAIPLASGKVGRARLYLPPNFDENKKYPLMIDVYGGPDSQKITYGFGYNWGSSLVSDKNVIYGYIDGRGSGRQTRENLFLLNNKLGTVEIEDQIAAAKWLIAETGFIDTERTAIWGWSYGGYATAMAMSQDTEQIFKCGISVAPVTSWLYYDTIYTERYMGLPVAGDNLINYVSSDVNTHVDNFKNKQFLLVHGNADDNVHYQQSMILARALEKADIMFNQISYPDEAHSISGTTKHLYHSLEKFLFRDCFTEVVEEPTSDSFVFRPNSWMYIGLIALSLLVAIRQ